MKGHNYGNCRKCGKFHKSAYVGGKPSPRKGISMIEEYGEQRAEIIKQSISKSVVQAMQQQEIRSKFIAGIEKREKLFGDRNPSCRPEVIAKLSEMFSGVSFDERFGDRSSEIRKKCGHQWLPEENPFFGKHHTEESKKKIGARHYIDGISIHTGYSNTFNDEIKDKVKQRDEFKCKECGRYGSESRLSIHHIDYDKTNNVEDNLITLCNSCHMKTNSNRSNWRDYFKQILANNLKEVST